ncbi:MAG: DUF6044 family protein [Erysipelotrichaceae bacterium]|nr:DUF6044 family protein [Erysipelotrichaceae bacterium]
MENKTFPNNILKKLMILSILLGLCFYVLPIVFMGENYIYTVHDTLDSFAGTSELLHDNGMFLSEGGIIPVMGGMEWFYFTICLYVYNLFNYAFGFVGGQIVTRIFTAVVGFSSSFYLLNYVFKVEKDDIFKKFVICLISIAYIITPCAVNRTISYAFLPVIITGFLHLSKRDKFTKLTLLTVLFPLFEQFNAFLIFVCGFWLLFTIIDTIVHKKINWNLWGAFLLICMGTVIVDLSYMIIALNSSSGSRSLYVDARSSFTFNYDTAYAIYKYMKTNQGWTPTLHMYILFPTTLVFFVYYVYDWLIKKNKKSMSKALIIFAGYVFWLLSATIAVFQEGGLKTGIMIIDGLQIGRVMGYMRLVWFGLFAMCALDDRNNKYIKVFMTVLIVAQIGLIMCSSIRYNDANATWRYIITGEMDDDNLSVTYFFSEDQFTELKEDINYQGEGVAAYGFHPSVLLYNGFTTLDGYLTIHSMEQQENFREIIAPALEEYSKYESYYDNWGGRMYLYGELDYDPSLEKDVEAADLYIDTEAFKKYGGTYIISRAEIANAEDIDLTYVNDYDGDFYHLYLYCAN